MERDIIYFAERGTRDWSWGWMNHNISITGGIEGSRYYAVMMMGNQEPLIISSKTHHIIKGNAQAIATLLSATNVKLLEE